MMVRRLFQGIDSRPSRGRVKVGSDEHSQQVIVCDALDAGDVFYFAVPNGANVSKRERAKLVAEGLKAGIPDLVLPDPPPARPGAPGAVLEMKKEKGGRVSAVQREKMARFRALGWEVMIAFGAVDALSQLRRLGYPV